MYNVLRLYLYIIPQSLDLSTEFVHEIWKWFCLYKFILLRYFNSSLLASHTHHLFHKCLWIFIKLQTAINCPESDKFQDVETISPLMIISFTSVAFLFQNTNTCIGCIIRSILLDHKEWRLLFRWQYTIGRSALSHLAGASHSAIAPPPPYRNNGTVHHTLLSYSWFCYVTFVCMLPNDRGATLWVLCVYQGPTFEHSQYHSLTAIFL
jgi:hypothetical protein